MPEQPLPAPLNGEPCVMVHPADRERAAKVIAEIGLPVIEAAYLPRGCIYKDDPRARFPIDYRQNIIRLEDL